MAKNDDWRSVDLASLRGMKKEDMTTRQRIAVANRGMEESSTKCVRILYQTMDVADETSKELYRQSEALDRTEAHLDRIDVDLDHSKRSMREIKSVWGGLVNNVASAKQRIKSRVSPSPPPPQNRHQQAANKKAPSQVQPKAQAKSSQLRVGAQAESTGNEIVDRNLDELEKNLHMLEGQARVIGHQLDESMDQIDRIRDKADDRNIRLKSINRDLSGELRR